MNLTQRNLSTDDMARAIDVLRRELSPVKGFLRAVYQRQPTQPWRFVMGRCSLTDDCPEEGEEIYRDCAFVCKSFSAPSPQEFISILAKDGLAVHSDLPPVRIKIAAANWSEHVIPTTATTTGFPAREFSARIDEESWFSDQQLVGYDMPYHASAAARVRDFIGLPHFHGPNDARKGELLIEVRDERGAIRIANGCLSVAGRLEDLCLVGQINSEPTIKLMAGERMAFDEKDISKIELWLLTSNNEILDYRSSSEWPYQHRLEPEVQSRARIQGEIERGESEACEFKRYIDVKDKTKSLEVVRTVCAFANSRGGRLFLGVNDEGEVEGIERGVAKDHSANPNEAALLYTKSLQALLRENLRNNQCFSIETVEIFERLTVVISVAQSAEINYLLNSGQAYMRRGATDRKMSPADITARESAPRHRFVD